ncbi:NAC domain containing protein [Quillaja saponaria]|uniref:NAC domain containing protein n=1 Tax=Quillaja saponaria TaxID=32244 RepID=A0AAD7VGP7_QUISA|nr:NAC domain containing protein [Quillaja saponaria]
MLFRIPRSFNRAIVDVNELPRETQNLSVVCKRESLDDYPSPHLDNPKPFSLIRYKRRRHNNSNSSHSTTSENSARTREDPCSSTATTAATTLATMSNAAATNTGTKRSFLSALVEYSLLESLEPKDSPSVHPPELDVANLDKSVPPSCLKYIKNLQNEMHKISVERETLKFELMSAQSVVNILKSRIDLLNKENEDLSRTR